MESSLTESHQNPSASTRAVTSGSTHEITPPEGSLNLILNKIGDLKKQLTTQKSESPDTTGPVASWGKGDEKTKETNGEPSGEVKDLKMVIEEKDKRIEELRQSFSQLQEKFTALQAGKGKRDEECKYLTRELDVARLLVSQLEYEKRREDEAGTDASHQHKEQNKKTEEEEEADREVEEERFNRVMREMEIERCRRQELEEEVEKLKEEIRVLKAKNTQITPSVEKAHALNEKVVVLDRSELENLSQVLGKMEKNYIHTKTQLVVETHKSGNSDDSTDDETESSESDEDEEDEDEESEEDEEESEKRKNHFNFSNFWPPLPGCIHNGSLPFHPPPNNISTSNTQPVVPSVSSIHQFLLPSFATTGVENSLPSNVTASLYQQLFDNSSPLPLPLPPPPPLLASLSLPSIPPPLSPQEFFSLFSPSKFNTKPKKH